MADENSNEHENEVMPGNSLPVEVEVPEKENGDDALDTKNKEEGQAGASVEEDSAPGIEGFVEKKSCGWNLFRMLVPVQKVGVIIGVNGENIKEICTGTGAQIKVLDAPPGAKQRTVLISGKENLNNSMPIAMDGLLKVHQCINNTQSASSICSKLIVAGHQAKSLIGKEGATVMSFQKDSKCRIRLTSEKPDYALLDDSVVEINGKPAEVRTALELIATHLSKYLVNQSVVSKFETQIGRPNACPNQKMPPSQPWGPRSHRGFSMYTGGGPGFGSNPFMPPQHQYDNYYSRAEMPPPPSVQPQQSIVTKVLQKMHILSSDADAVADNIGSIYSVSGATIAMHETWGFPNEVTVEINGSASQVQIAQQLIQIFVAAAHNAAASRPAQEAYNNPGHVPTYPSQPPPAKDFQKEFMKAIQHN